MRIARALFGKIVNVARAKPVRLAAQFNLYSYDTGAETLDLNGLAVSDQYAHIAAFPEDQDR